MKQKRRKHRKSIHTREPIRGVVRERSNDSVISMRSTISGMSTNISTDDADVDTKKLNCTNQQSLYYRDIKMKAAKNVGSNRSIMSELTDISNALDDMTLGESSVINVTLIEVG